MKLVIAYPISIFQNPISSLNSLPLTTSYDFEAHNFAFLAL